MIHDTGDQQRCERVEHADLSSPFDRVGFSCGRGQGADAGHIEAYREDEGQSLRLGKVGGQYL